MQKFVYLKSHKAKTILPLTIVGLLVFGGFFFWLRLGDNRGYAPEQPIPFNHKKHAGDFKIDCRYCHEAVDKSRHATVPSMNICMNCHSVVKPDSPHIQKLKALVEQGDSFEWIRVHDMPDFVFFSHKRHIAKGVSCEKCHGDVQNMKRVTQMEMLNMGFCIECHRENNAPTSCDACHH